jgi:Ca2+-binding EF-hand superfamily protein
MLGPEGKQAGTTSPRSRGKKIFAQMDVNGDKELTLAEFTEGCMNDKELFAILTAGNKN